MASLPLQKEDVMLPKKSSAAKTSTLNPSKINALFVSEGDRMLNELNNMIENKSILKGSQGLRSFLINVHGLRSALFVMNEPELSAAAARLELLCREESIDMIYAETPAFLANLQTLIAKIAALDAETKDGKVYISEGKEDKEFLREKLLVIQIACKDYDDRAIESTIEQLRKKRWSQTTEELLVFITDQLLLGDFRKISETIENIIRE